MTGRFPFTSFLLALGLVAGLTGCARHEAPAPAGTPVAKHEHHPPHGGTPVVLGEELYHLELVRDAATGRLSAYVLDGEMEDFVRIAEPALDITATVNGQPRRLVLAAVANPATGETAGSTSLFEAQADWLKTTKEFDAVLARIEVRGTTFIGVAFNFPKGNDRD
jgi:hypothetical protein